jgi:hypothetical protein
MPTPKRPKKMPKGQKDDLVKKYDPRKDKYLTEFNKATTKEEKDKENEDFFTFLEESRVSLLDPGDPENAVDRVTACYRTYCKCIHDGVVGQSVCQQNLATCLEGATLQN